MMYCKSAPSASQGRTDPELNLQSSSLELLDAVVARSQHSMVSSYCLIFTMGGQVSRIQVLVSRVESEIWICFFRVVVTSRILDLGPRILDAGSSFLLLRTCIVSLSCAPCKWVDVVNAMQ